jgi:preprotein translocase subunit SecG
LTARDHPTTLPHCYINRFSETIDAVFGLLLTLLILDGLLLVVVVLLQAGKGGGLAAMGGGGGAGTENFMGGRQAATVLTRATWTTGALFLALSVVLSILSSRSQEDASVLQEEFRQTAPAAPQPILPGAGEGAAGEGNEPSPDQ